MWGAWLLQGAEEFASEAQIYSPSELQRIRDLTVASFPSGQTLLLLCSWTWGAGMRMLIIYKQR